MTSLPSPRSCTAALSAFRRISFFCWRICRAVEFTLSEMERMRCSGAYGITSAPYLNHLRGKKRLRKGSSGRHVCN